jgi:MarR-like DNA-binding transcriptional regulator SgrR of sgrS sRNA
MMEEALKSGQQHNALELAQLALKSCGAAAPFGRAVAKRHADAAHPYYRSLEPLQPGFLPGRAEQHLAGRSSQA